MLDATGVRLWAEIDEPIGDDLSGAGGDDVEKLDG